jgi:hypothetical protein
LEQIVERTERSCEATLDGGEGSQDHHQEKVLHVDMGFFQNAMLGKKSH